MPERTGVNNVTLPHASLEEFCCPGTAESPSWDGWSLGWLESLDHCGLGSWDPGAEENYMENGGF